MKASLALPVRSVRIQTPMEKIVIKSVTVNMECVMKVQRGMDSVFVSRLTLGSAVIK